MVGHSIGTPTFENFYVKSGKKREWRGGRDGSWINVCFYKPPDTFCDGFMAILSIHLGYGAVSLCQRQREHKQPLWLNEGGSGSAFCLIVGTQITQCVGILLQLAALVWDLALHCTFHFGSSMATHAQVWLCQWPNLALKYVVWNSTRFFALSM